MPVDDIYSKPLPLVDPTLYKAVTPLTPEAQAELEKVQALDVSDFYEQEVRSNVIDPVIRVLGYGKGTNFSLDEGRPLRILDTDKFPDYKFHLWKENFWLIEAKRPRKGEDFKYDDLKQAILYSAHPEVNATLVVLCDGEKFQIFDREVSLAEPALHVNRADLVRDFHKLQAFLEPMQIWFFEKRRIARSIDKVFGKEFNLQRVEEFRSFIDRRLSSKRNVVLENFRANIKPDSEERIKHLEAASIEELIEAHMFIVRSTPEMNAMLRKLAAEARKNAFHVLNRIFPYEPRDANDPYYAHALGVLMEMGRSGDFRLNWLPIWLQGPRGNEASLDDVTKQLIHHCLTYFDGDHPRKIILLAAAAFRRLFKVMAIASDQQWKIGELLHVAQRYQAPEMTWQQILSSPAGHLLGQIQLSALDATVSFVKQCSGDGQAFMRSGAFKPEVAKLRLKDIWRAEVALLRQIGNYPKLRQERDLGDMEVVEMRSITYDFLGHMSLCVMHGHEKWQNYVREEHRDKLEDLAALGSWSAKDMLGLKHDAPFARLTEAKVADRFFFGDVEILRSLQDGYAGRTAGVRRTP